MQQHSRSNVVLSPRSTSFARKQSATGQQANITSFNSSEFDAMAPIAAADKPDAGIRSIDTDEVMAGAIPREGFTLRLINGGTGSGTACSRCHWLKHCQGCVLPDDANVQVQLRDGESIAVDWHYVVFEDLLDVQALSHIRRHDSMREERSSAFDLRTPLSDCLDKFTEQENLEDIVCPRCHDSDHMKRSFSLWRLPPVLIVQLKRFQFDRYSRRKLTNRIDFPFENLDLREYLAHSQLQQQSHAQSVAGGSAKAATDASAALKMNALYGSFESLTDTAAASDREGLCSGGEGAAPAGACTRYDLYSVIHHLGALGGGHYAATIRHPRHDAKGRLIPAHDQQQQGLFSSIISGVSNIMDVEGDSGHGADSVEPVAARSHQPEHEVPATRFQADDPWYIYNDNLVTEVTNTSELSAPSAYVLFYMRQDVEYKNINELLQEQLGDHFAALDGSSTACNAPAAANVIEAQPAASAASIPIVSDVVKADGISRGVGMSRDAATKPGKMPFTAASISLRGSDPSVSFSTSDGTSAEISTLAAAAAASRGPMLGGQGSRSKSSVSRTSPHAATVQHEASDSGSSERDRSRRGSGGGAVPGNDSESFQNDQPLYLTSSNAVKNRQYAPPVNGVAASAAMESEADPNCVMQ